jgi:hypothetical protein
MAHGKRRPLAERGKSDLLTAFLDDLHGASPKNDNARIAQRAAQLIAEGLTDYRAAKLKAARQLGINARDAMPDNGMIDAALRSHYALFDHDKQPKALSALRDIAITVMSRLGEFEPWLVGPVLTGTANANSDIDIEIVGVDSKRFEMYLLDACIEFTLGESRRPTSGKTKENGHPIFAAEFDNVPVLIALYDSHTERNSANPRGSIRHDRAQIKDVMARFLVDVNP